MNRLKRFLCILLAVIILFNAPGYVPKAQAVAAVDDAAVITLGLLMVTLAGVTFAQCNQAVSSVRSFLYNRSSAASSLLTLVTKCWVDGGKVLLNGDFRGAFSDILPSIHDYFVTTDGVGKVGNAVGTVFSPTAVFNYDSIDSLPDLSPYLIYQWVDGASYIMSTSRGGYKGTYRGSNSRLLFYSLTSGQVLPPDPYVITTYGNCFGVIVNKGVSYLVYQNRNGKAEVSSFLCWGSSSSPGSFYLSDGDISFSQSGTVDGSLTVGNLDSADLKSNDIYLPVPSYSGVVSSGLAGSTAAPGLSPDVITKAIQDAVIALPLPTTPPASEPTTATEPTDQPIVPMDPVTPGFLGDKFSDLNTTLETIKQGFLDVLNSILSVIQTISDCLTRGFAAVTTWLDAFWDTFKQVISDFWSDVVTAVTVTIPTFLGDIADAAVEFFTVTFPAWVADVKDWALAFPQTLIDALLAALAAAFVPAAGYWDAKVAACTAAFPLFNSIIATGHGLSGFLSGLGTRPPVIYIDLGSSTSWFLGGRQIFLDLTWYSQYKPTMDLVISGFLWLLVAWRFFLRLPGLLRGEDGTVDRLNTYFDNKGDNK